MQFSLFHLALASSILSFYKHPPINHLYDIHMFGREHGTGLFVVRRNITNPEDVNDTIPLSIGEPDHDDQFFSVYVWHPETNQWVHGIDTATLEEATTTASTLAGSEFPLGDILASYEHVDLPEPSPFDDPNIIEIFGTTSAHVDHTALRREASNNPIFGYAQVKFDALLRRFDVVEFNEFYAGRSYALMVWNATAGEWAMTSIFGPHSHGDNHEESRAYVRNLARSFANAKQTDEETPKVKDGIPTSKFDVEIWASADGDKVASIRRVHLNDGNWQPIANTEPFVPGEEHFGVYTWNHDDLEWERHELFSDMASASDAVNKYINDGDLILGHLIFASPQPWESKS